MSTWGVQTVIKIASKKNEKNHDKSDMQKHRKNGQRFAEFLSNPEVDVDMASKCDLPCSRLCGVGGMRRQPLKFLDSVVQFWIEQEYSRLERAHSRIEQANYRISIALEC